MASNRKKDIDQLFKGKLEDHSSEVPFALWDKISAKLDENQGKGQVVGEDPLVEPLPADFGTKKKKLGGSWFLKIAAGLLLFGFLIWRLQPNEVRTRPDESLAGQTQELVQKQKPAQSNDDHGVKPEDTSKPVVAEGLPPQRQEESRPTEKVETRLAYVEPRPEQADNTAEDPTASEGIESDDSQQTVKRSGVALNAEEAIAMANTDEDDPVVNDPVFESVPDAAEITLETVGQEHDLLTSTEKTTDEEGGFEESLASSLRERPKLLSGVLNFVANNLQVGGSQVVEFNETDQGILQVDVKALFNK
ncbi:hypothetical protein [Albibacterium indicum]|uniref:hypothetical protein n=1 Tax=Albibacterium indicum TaxID=2292082 RepID=UPI000E556618|nr:hypothetical protein [Pedobacter indicus]